MKFRRTKVTVVSIMPRAINETVRGFEEGATTPPVASGLGELAMGDVRACVDDMYAKHDGNMLKLLTKLALNEVPTESTEGQL